MMLNAERLQYGLHLVVSLRSFPLFCVYLLLIFLSGVWQRVTSPIHLRPLLILHNFGCCIASFCTLIGFCYGIYLSDSMFDKSASDILRPYFWMYWITKNVELLDTVFMIVRHRQRQISFLHIYHHGSMLLLSDLSYHLYPWPAIAVFLAMNSFVHVILYMYYGSTALFPDNPPQWKKLMTQIQILQFLVGFVIAGVGYIHHGYCVYSILYGLTMTTLFSNFYYHAYVKVKKAQKTN